jgi:hypothetical protein
MARKKRKPGGGRKKLPPDRARSAMLTARVYPDLKADLERACERSGKTLSDEIEERLRRSFSKREDAFGDDRTRWFALLVARLATRINGRLGLHWRDDRWAYEALLAGIPALLSMMAPKGEAKMPGMIADQIGLYEHDGLPEYADLFRTPKAFGAFTAFDLRELAIGDGKEIAEASKHNYDLGRAALEVGMDASEWATDGDKK